MCRTADVTDVNATLSQGTHVLDDVASIRCNVDSTLRVRRDLSFTIICCCCCFFVFFVFFVFLFFLKQWFTYKCNSMF